jgi:hypothetical protein
LKAVRSVLGWVVAGMTVTYVLGIAAIGIIVG